MIKRRIIYAVIIIISFLLQTTFFQTLSFLPVAPNLLMIFTSLIGLMRGQREGMVLGLICGVLIDLFFSPYMGVYALIYMYIGFGCGFFNKMFYPHDYKLPIAIVAGSDLIYGLLVFFFMFLFRNRTAFGIYLIRVILPELVITMVIALMVYFPLQRLNLALEESERTSLI